MGTTIFLIGGIVVSLFVPGFLWTFFIYPIGFGRSVLHIRLAVSPILSLVLLGVTTTALSQWFQVPINTINVTVTSLAIGLIPLPILYSRDPAKLRKEVARILRYLAPGERKN